MKIHKKAILSLVFILLFGVFNCNAFAFGYDEHGYTEINDFKINPFWSNIDMVSASLDSNSNTLYPSAYVSSRNSNDSIGGFLNLERYENGRWIVETSWRLSGTSSASISRSYTGTKGFAYRERVSVTVGGERASSTSRSISL